MKNLITRTIFGALFVIIMVGGIVWRADTFILLFAIITGMTLWEYSGLINKVNSAIERDQSDAGISSAEREQSRINSFSDIVINRFISTVAGVYFFLAVAAYCIGIVDGIVVFVPYIITIMYLFISELYLKHKDPIACWAYTMLGQMYIALPFSLINLLAFNEDAIGITYNWLLPLSLFIFLWANDTGAYCVGSLLGKHRLFPRVSPKKSWEGSIGGAVLVLLIAYLIGFINNMTVLDADKQPALFSATLSIIEWMGLGAVVVVFGTWGDLVESLLKRTLGIKDSGNIIPGHGGMLDRFDSSLLAIPAAVVYLYTIAMV